jgi:hypothetical protein
MALQDSGVLRNLKMYVNFSPVGKWEHKFFFKHSFHKENKLFILSSVFGILDRILKNMSLPLDALLLEELM